ncbi:MAG: marine proteobacterial sortase target protein, partial [Fimbriimonadaceae bacterium]|nr:marine proteobacterial sortase target protein [Alphaproteobacteria bacterium]
GVYVFPLPDMAAVDTLRMKIGDRLIKGQIKERRLARELYERARDNGQRASLIEQERANIFTNSVANIGPGEVIVIQIQYQETVQQSNGTFSLRFPMVVGPRYNPRPTTHTVDFGGDNGWGNVDPVPDRDRITPPVRHPDLGKINPVTLRVTLNPGFPLDAIESPHHEIDLTRSGKETATLSLGGEPVPADQDFELTWKAAGTAPSAALFRENVDNEDYVLLFLTPPSSERDRDREILPREIIYVIDNSGSMGGQSIVQAKASLLFALNRLRPVDRFNVIRFDDTMDQVFSGAVAATPENIAIARRFVSRLSADGGTEMLPALKAALIDGNPSGTNSLRQVIFLTDGAIGNENQMFREITANRGRTRVFTVGIGSAPNSFFMSRAAEIGRGTFTHIGSADQVRERMTELFVKLENPVLTDLEASWSGGVVQDISPDPLPDLYSGEPIVLTARASDLPDALQISGMLDGNPWTVTVPLDKAKSGTGIGKLWARRRIASLEVARHSRGNDDKIEKSILDVALAHHLVSRLTSLVAIDVTPVRPDDKNLTRTEMPTNLPDGWDFDKVFGEDRPAPTMPLQQRVRAQAVRGGVLQQNPAMAQEADDDLADQSAPTAKVAALAAPAPMQSAAASGGARTGGVLLPQTATPAVRHILLGLMMLIFAGMCLFTRHLWVNAGRAFGLTDSTTSRRSNHIRLR